MNSVQYTAVPNKMSSSKLMVRLATKEDKTAILDLDPNREIYGGCDYIPASFDEFVQDPDREMKVICNEEDEIVSSCFRLVNVNTTMYI